MSAFMAIGLTQLFEVWHKQPDQSPTLQTTLYDLISALHDVVEPGEEDLVVATVAHWSHAGRIKCPTTSDVAPQAQEIGDGIRASGGHDWGRMGWAISCTRENPYVWL